MEIFYVIKNIGLVIIVSCFAGGVAVYIRNINFQYRKDKKLTLFLIIVNLIGYASLFIPIIIIGGVIHSQIEKSEFWLLIIETILFGIISFGMIAKFKK